MAAKVVLVQRIQAYSHLSQMAVDRVSVNESQSQYLPTYLPSYLPIYISSTTPISSSPTSNPCSYPKDKPKLPGFGVL